MSSIGSGCREIRVRDKDGTFRVFYVATIDETVYVLHTFQKKTQTTSKADWTWPNSDTERSGTNDDR